MGKKDLLKSTTKKKKPQKKVGADEKATQKKMPAKKAAPSKKLTGTDLLLQKFDSWKPATLFRVELNQEDEKNFTSPPFFTDQSKQEMDAIHHLLSLKFDIQKIIEKGERAAAEKAAAEKAAAEKAAAEKAAAEKAAAEKAAAEKAAAEKAAAEKAAAEKAAAEKAAAEKAAAEKAAAEKAAAEKAAAEKAAAEKAAAEKTAAEKAAAEKAAAGKIESVKTTKAIPNAACAEEKTEPDPSKKMLVIIAACLAFIFTPIILASFLNTTNYYLQVSDGALELWQGEFAPLGKNIVISMPGALPPETIKEVYCKKEVFPIVSGYLLDKADTLIEIEGLSNFQHIKSTLQEAQAYAVTKPIQIKIDDRLTRIEFMNLMYKADVSAESASSEGKGNAIHYLEKAALLDLNVHEAEMVKKKLSALQGEQQK